MAYKLELRRPIDGMSFIWNVSSRVGDSVSCPNKASDVDLVALMLGAFIGSVLQPKDIHPACQQNFLINGKMDINIAYWIRAVNYSHHGKGLNFTDQGIISRARGRSYGQTTWTIVKLNLHMRQHKSWAWENLPNHPDCSTYLKNDLLNRTRP